MILDKVKNNLKNGIDRFAKEAGLAESEVQLLIQIEIEEENGEVVYYLMHNYKKIRKVLFKEIINVKIDILGQGIIVSNFIGRYMMTIAEEGDKDITGVSVMICKRDGELRLYEYYEQQYIKELNLDEIVQT
jgi:hypothetical protein